MQCAAVAAASVGSATGIRAWLRIRFGDRTTPRVMRVLSVCLLSVGVLAAGVGLGGSG